MRRVAHCPKPLYTRASWAWPVFFHQDFGDFLYVLFFFTPFVHISSGLALGSPFSPSHTQLNTMLTITMCVCSCMCVSMNNKEKIRHADMSLFHCMCVCVCLSGRVLIYRLREGAAGFLYRHRSWDVIQRVLSAPFYPWRQGGTRQSAGALRGWGWRGFKPSSESCITTHITIKRSLLHSFKFQLLLMKFECWMVHNTLMFKCLCIEFPLQAYCGGTAMGNKNCLADIRGCLSIVLQGFGKGLELCHHERIWK